MPYLSNPRLTHTWSIDMRLDPSTLQSIWINNHDDLADISRLAVKKYDCYNVAYEGARTIAGLMKPGGPVPKITMKANLQQRPSSDESRLPIRESILASSWDDDAKHDLEWTMRMMSATVADNAEFRFFLQAQMANPGHTNFHKILKNDFGVEPGGWLWYSEVLAIKDEADLIQFKIQFDSLGSAPLFVLPEA